MSIKNEMVVDATSKYIVKSTGIKSEKNQLMIEGGVEGLTDGNTDSTASLIECYHLIEGTGTVTISSESEDDDLELTGKGKYGLRPGQLKFGNDKIFKLTTDSNITSYLLVTEFRRN